MLKESNKGKECSNWTTPEHIGQADDLSMVASNFSAKDGRGIVERNPLGKKASFLGGYENSI